MIMLKALFPIFWYFVSWQRIQLWVAGLGITFWVLSLSMLIVGLLNDRTFQPSVLTGMFMFGYVFVFIFPLLTSGLAFRSLVSRNQFILAPQAGQYALLALLIFTLLLPLLPFLVFLLLEGPPDNHVTFLLTAIQAFNFASFFQALCQARPPRFIIRISGILAWFIFIGIVSLPKSILTPLFHPAVTVLIFVLVLYGWLWAFKRMKSARSFKPVNQGLIFNAFSGNVHNSPDRFDVTASQLISPTESLYYNILTNTPSQFLSAFLRVVIWPFFFLLIVILLSYNTGKEPSFDSYQQVYLAFSAFIAIVMMFRHGELISRSKYLWLRTGNQRGQLWNLIDRIILHELLMICFVSACLALTFYLLDEMSLIIAGSYLLDVISLSAFFTWLTIFCSIRKGLSASPLFLFGILLSVSLLLASGFGQGKMEDTYLNILPASLSLLLIGLIFRQLAAHTFAGIDWLQIKPNLLRGRSRS